MRLTPAKFGELSDAGCLFHLDSLDLHILMDEAPHIFLTSPRSPSGGRLLVHLECPVPAFPQPPMLVEFVSRPRDFLTEVEFDVCPES